MNDGTRVCDQMIMSLNGGAWLRMKGEQRKDQSTDDKGLLRLQEFVPLKSTLSKICLMVFC